MPRTPEQIDADDALTAAIEQVCKAYNLGEGDVIGDYVVVVANQAIDEEGQVTHSYALLLRDGKVSGVSAVGLLECAAFDVKMGRSD